MSPLFAEIRGLVHLSMPIGFGLLCSALLTFSDTLMAGLAGSRDLAGVAAGGALFFPTLMFLQGQLSAYSAKLGRLCGAGRHNEIAPACYAALSAAVISALSMMALLYTATFIIDLKGDTLMAQHFRHYLYFAALALPDAALLMVLKASSEALGAPRLSAFAAFMMLLLNLPLNYLCIFTLGLGGRGCGLATLISISLTAGALLLILRRYSSIWAQLHLTAYRFNSAEVKNCLRISLPLGIAAAIESAAFALIALCLTPLGPSVTAGHSIAMCVNSLIFVLPLAIGLAACIRGAQAYGAQDKALYHLRLKVLMCLSTLVIMLTVSTTFILKDVLPSLFTHDAAAAALASALLNYALFNQIFEHLQCILSLQLRIFKLSHVVLKVTLFCFYLLALPGGAALCFGFIGPNLGAAGFWLALSITLPLPTMIYAVVLHRALRQSFKATLQA